jgi:hypothetical protein
VKPRALVVVAPLFLSVPLFAQDTNTPFREGQWAAQFAGGFSSIGVIKFKSPTRALVLDVSVSGEHHEEFAGDTVSTINSHAFIRVQLGRRVYRPVAERIVAQHTFGLVVAVDHNASTNPFLGSTHTTQWGGGPFAELGAVYLLTPHLGIGATGTASITYSRVSGESFTGSKTHGWASTADTHIAFAATIFF